MVAQVECPFCARAIPADSVRCPLCGLDVPEGLPATVAPPALQIEPPRPKPIDPPFHPATVRQPQPTPVSKHPNELRERWQQNSASLRFWSGVLAILLMLSGILTILSGVAQASLPIMVAGVISVVFAAFIGMAGLCLASLVEQGIDR